MKIKLWLNNYHNYRYNKNQSNTMNNSNNSIWIINNKNMHLQTIQCKNHLKIELHQTKYKN